MNIKAQAGSYALAFMMAVCVIILGIALAFPLNETASNAMGNITGDGTDGMNCTSTTDNFVKAGCLTTDLSQFYFIGGLIAISGIIIGGRILFSG